MKLAQCSLSRRLGAIAVTLCLLASSSPAWLIMPRTAHAAQTWIVASLADDGSAGTLRHAIDNSAEGDTISFAEGLHGTILLDPALGELTIVHALVIEGPGANSMRVDGGGEIRVLMIDEAGVSGIESAEDLLQMEPAQNPGATVVIRGLTFRNGAVHSDDVILDAIGGNVAVLGSNVSFEDCVIEDGQAIGGGGIAVAASVLSLHRCTIRGNSAGGLGYDVGFAGGGGGLLTAVAYVTAVDCIFEDNVSHDDTEGVGLGGGITALLSACSFTGCTIKGNYAGRGDDTMGGLGGGVFALANLLLAMQDCTISENAAGSGGQGGMGGGVCVAQSFITIIARSLVADNTAGSDDAVFAAGGGVAAGLGTFSIDLDLNEVLPEGADGNLQPAALPTVPFIMVNSTLSGNRAVASIPADQPQPGTVISGPSYGGGASATGVAPLALIFCTVTDNTAAVGGGVSTMMVVPATQEPEPELALLGCLLVRNSIVAGNSASGASGSDDLFGPIKSYLGNLIEDPTGWADVGQPQPDEGCSDLIDMNPRLGPLADNGGPTMTHALLTGSPALDAACNSAIATGYSTLDDVLTSLGYSPVEPGALPLPGDTVQIQVDQRSESRPVDGDGDGESLCDIGAFEARPDIAVAAGSNGRIAAPMTTSGECSVFHVTITNEGTAPLLLDSIVFEGEDAGDFSLISDPSGTILGPGRSLQLSVRFCPRSPGARNATLVVYSTDPDEPVVEVNLVARADAEPRDDRRLAPASMSTSYLLVDPAQVLPGQQVIISANVCNSGAEKGTLTATLMVNGSAEQSQSAAVSGGSCKQVVFAVAKAVPGTYQVAVNGMQGQFTVLAPRIVQASVASQQDTGLGTTGLIAIAAIMVILVAALVYVFRKD